jgi:hypothetical protein
MSGIKNPKILTLFVNSSKENFSYPIFNKNHPAIRNRVNEILGLSKSE